MVGRWVSSRVYVCPYVAPPASARSAPNGEAPRGAQRVRPHRSASLLHAQTPSLHHHHAQATCQQASQLPPVTLHERARARAASAHTAPPRSGRRRDSNAPRPRVDVAGRRRRSAMLTREKLVY